MNNTTLCMFINFLRRALSSSSVSVSSTMATFSLLSGGGAGLRDVWESGSDFDFVWDFRADVSAGASAPGIRLSRV
jgi:hypothetical protein